MKANPEGIKIVKALLLFVFFLALAKPLAWVIEVKLGFMEQESKFMSGVLTRSILCIMTYFYIIKEGFGDLGSITMNRKPKNLQAIVIISVIILMTFVGKLEIYASTTPFLLFLFTISVLVVGFLEEFLFRGLILPFLIRIFKRKSQGPLLSVIVSALLFGLLHYLNLFKEDQSFIGISSQVLFATSIGVFFGALFLRTRSIWVVAILHGLFNFTFGTSDLIVDSVEIESAPEDFSLVSYLPTLFLFALIIAAGVFTLKQIDKKEIFSALSMED